MGNEITIKDTLQLSRSRYQRGLVLRTRVQRRFKSLQFFLIVLVHSPYLFDSALSY